MKLIKQGFCQNYWLWFHIFSAAILTRFFNLFLNKLLTVLVILSIAIIWEIIEYKVEGISAYKNKEKWAYDTAGDILGAVIISLIMLI